MDSQLLKESKLQKYLNKYGIGDEGLFKPGSIGGGDVSPPKGMDAATPSADLLDLIPGMSENRLLSGEMRGARMIPHALEDTSMITPDVLKYKKTGEMSPRLNALLNPAATTGNDFPLDLQQRLSQPLPPSLTTSSLPPEDAKLLEFRKPTPVETQQDAWMKSVVDPDADTEIIDTNKKASGYATGGLVSMTPTKNRYVDQSYNSFGAAHGGTVPKKLSKYFVK